MALPDHLPSYEFKRKLAPSRDIGKFYHLHMVKTPDGIPCLAPEGTPAFTPIDTESFFDKSGPMEVEIGCGKGGFMVEYCEKHPDKPFLGIDQEASIAYLAAKRMAKREHLTHARVVYGDVFYFFRDFLPGNSVAAFHMYFPDPWPKKRHRKRRTLNLKFLEQIYRISINQALFYWATDDKNYHEESRELFNSRPWVQVFREQAEPTEGIRTNFEKKYRARGKEIYRAVLKVVKTTSPALLICF